MSNPLWSLGKASRFSRFNNAFAVNNNTPGPIYSPSNEQKYKFRTSPRWGIGTEVRPRLFNGEEYEHFKHPYVEKDDLGKLPKRWARKVGGALSLEPRIKFEVREGFPGPGRYDPSHKLTKPNNYTSYIGERFATLTLKNLTGTDEVVGPGTYPVERSKYTSIHQTSPRWTLAKDKRKGLFNRYWTKNETYEIYSSCADQIRTHKVSEPKINIGKSTRAIEKVRGIFPQHMERIPTKVTIRLPKM